MDPRTAPYDADHTTAEETRPLRALVVWYLRLNAIALGLAVVLTLLVGGPSVGGAASAAGAALRWCGIG